MWWGDELFQSQALQKVSYVSENFEKGVDLKEGTWNWIDFFFFIVMTLLFIFI